MYSECNDSRFRFKVQAIKPSNDRLNVCHVNAGAIFPKIHEFRYVFGGVKLDVIVASETWFKSYRSNKSVSVEDYEIVRNDRYAKQSGGAAIYIRKGLNYKMLTSSEGLKSEYVFIELIFLDSKILLGAYYIAPKVDELDIMENILSELIPMYEDIIIIGDFNKNLFDSVNGLTCSYCVRNSCTKCKFSDVLDSVFLRIILKMGDRLYWTFFLPTGLRKCLCSTRSPMACLNMTVYWGLTAAINALENLNENSDETTVK